MGLRLGKRLLVGVGVLTLTLAGLAPPANAVAGFGDVDSREFYSDAVQWMVDTGITTGTSAGCFSPDRVVTRAELATFLHRYAGQPPGPVEQFSDVPDGAWFQDAVAWMAGAGITTGTSATTFSPDRAVTRAEAATFLYRFSGARAVADDRSGSCGPSFEVSAAEAESLALLNRLRASHGLAPLALVADLTSAAQDWSAYMAASGKFAHSGGPYGENIAWSNHADDNGMWTAQLFHDMWVDSPGHYANMIDPSYTRVGVGFDLGASGWYASHVFLP